MSLPESLVVRSRRGSPNIVKKAHNISFSGSSYYSYASYLYSHSITSFFSVLFYLHSLLFFFSSYFVNVSSSTPLFPSSPLSSSTSSFPSQYGGDGSHCLAPHPHPGPDGVPHGAGEPRPHHQRAGHWQVPRRLQPLLPWVLPELLLHPVRTPVP